MRLDTPAVERACEVWMVPCDGVEGALCRVVPLHGSGTRLERFKGAKELDIIGAFASLSTAVDLSPRDVQRNVNAIRSGQLHCCSAIGHLAPIDRRPNRIGKIRCGGNNNAHPNTRPLHHHVAVYGLVLKCMLSRFRSYPKCWAKRLGLLSMERRMYAQAVSHGPQLLTLFTASTTCHPPGRLRGLTAAVGGLMGILRMNEPQSSMPWPGPSLGSSNGIPGALCVSGKYEVVP